MKRKIELSTHIQAPVDRVFDLARSIRLHLEANPESWEKILSGKKTGLLGEGETVCWSGVHFGFRQSLYSRVEELDRPHRFVSRMVKGVFKSLSHEHNFKASEDGCLMHDVFEFEVPMGFIGDFIAGKAVQNHLQRFLIRHNKHLKEVAEGDEWTQYLS